MAQNVTVAGASYPDVPSVVLPKTGGGSAQFTDISDTTATASDVASGKYFYTYDGVKTEGTASIGGVTVVESAESHGGTVVDITAGSISNAIKGRLIGSYPIGQRSTTSTTAHNTDVVITISESDLNKYDCFVFASGTSEAVNGRHIGTLSTVVVYGGNSLLGKSTANVSNYRLNYLKDSSGVIKSTGNTGGYGVYPYGVTLSNGEMTVTIYERYSSTYTTTINGNYTMRVYGLSFLELAGF